VVDNLLFVDEIACLQNVKSKCDPENVHNMDMIGLNYRFPKFLIIHL